MSIDIYKETVDHVNSMLWYVGGDSFTKDYSRWNWRLLLTGFVVIFYLAVSFYDFWLFSGNFFKLAFCLVTFSLGIQGMKKVELMFRHSDAAIKIHENLLDYFEESFDDRSIEIVKLKYAKLMKKVIRLFVFFFTILTVLSLIYPIAVYLIYNIKLLPYGFELPFFNPDTSPGYQLNYFHHFTNAFYTICGVTGTDSLFMVCAITAVMKIDVTVLMLDKLNELCNENDDEGSTTIYIKSQLREIHLRHRELLLYASNIEDMFSSQLLVVGACCVFQLSMVLFVASAYNWYPGYLFFVAFSTQLFLYCLIGTIFVVHNDKLEIAMQSVPHYLLPNEEKKAYLIMLCAVQRPVYFTFGGFSVLNMETFVEIFKTIYSYFMMLTSFKE